MSNGGDVGFQFFNKTNQDVNILLDKTFYVVNGIAFDYFKYRSHSETKSHMIQNYLTNSETSSIYESKIIIIPPKAAKRISEYNVTNELINSCELLLFPSSKKVKEISFNFNNTPIVFCNLITYNVGDDTIRLENKFYVSSLSNMPESEFFKTIPVQNCDKKSKKYIKVAKINGPEVFYIQYKYIKEED